jgi:hypothetical protein
MKRMKRIITLLLAVGVMGSVLTVGLGGRSQLSLLPVVHAQTVHEHSGCSVASLNGSYGFFRTGTTAVGPLAAVGIATFDGAGNSAGIQTIRKNGVTTSDLFTDPPLTATYEVEANCAGKFFGPDGSVFAHVVIVDRGRELFITSLSTGNTVTGVMKKMDED